MSEKKYTLDELLAKCGGGNPHGDLFEPNSIQVGFKRLNENATLPTKAHASDSGFDLYASEDVVIEPGETAIVPTAIALQLPEGYEAQVRPRSGVTSRTKLRVQLGTIDNGYNGEIGVIVDNIRVDEQLVSGGLYTVTDGNLPCKEIGLDYVNTESYIVRKGDRIAQLVVQPFPSVESYEISGELGETERGTGGFGSSGVRDGMNELSDIARETFGLGEDF